MKNVLYIEDDIVDQMAFRRMMKEHSKEFTCTIVSSITEFKKLPDINVFDVIITDYYLGDGGAEDVMNAFPNRKLIVVSGSINERLGNTEYLRYISKPIDYSLLIQAYQWVMQNNGGNKNGKFQYLDLTYLNQLGHGDNEFMKEMLQIAKEELIQNLADLNNSWQTDDYGGIKFHSHRFKSRSRILGLGLEEKANWVEFNANSSQKEAIRNTIDLFQNICDKVLVEIEIAKQSFD